jgi:hypothetical protein
MQEQAVKLCKKEYLVGDTQKVEDLATAYSAVKEVCDMTQQDTTQYSTAQHTTQHHIATEHWACVRNPP